MLGTELSTAFLNECVPLWFALVMGFTAPYMWSRYVKKGVKSVYHKYVGGGE